MSLKYDPTNGKVHLNIGQVYSATNMLIDAENHLKLSLELMADDDMEAYICLGEVQIKLKKFKEAEETFVFVLDCE